MLSIGVIRTDAVLFDVSPERCLADSQRLRHLAPVAAVFAQQLRDLHGPLVLVEHDLLCAGELNGADLLQLPADKQNPTR